MMKVKANRVVAYGGKEWQPGEVFEMEDIHAKVNVFNGRVSAAEDEAEKPKREKPQAPQARETLHPKKGKKDKPKDEDAKGKDGRYKRRDVRAEDETTREGED